MAAAVDSNDVWRVQSSDLVPIGGETDGDYNVFIRELIPSPGAGSMYEVMELLGKCVITSLYSTSVAMQV